MGAASCNAVCVGKKYARPSDSNPIKVIQRPSQHDLSSSMDDLEIHLDQQSNLLAHKVDTKDAKIGIHFMQEELIDKLSNKSR